MKRIYAQEHWCVDCGRCEVACKVFHSKSKDHVKAYFWESPQPQSRIRVEGDASLSAAVNCRHCREPLCVEACISGAMTKDAVTGIVSLDEKSCVGCGTCVSVCPFGCVHVTHDAGAGLAHKCDLCRDGIGQIGEPRCVAVCPNRALLYCESEEA
ncbi:MAG: 4Fe-4S dicluster domain-containing protein [Raoultibacter sp.]